MSDSAIKQRLQEMAQLSLLANRLSEIQEKNLKSYPFVFFNDVKTVKIDFDLQRNDIDGKHNPNRHVSYHLELNEENNKTLVEKRFFAITEATRMLFWNDLKVRVFFNGKTVYESPDEQPTS